MQELKKLNYSCVSFLCKEHDYVDWSIRKTLNLYIILYLSIFLSDLTSNFFFKIWPTIWPFNLDLPAITQACAHCCACYACDVCGRIFAWTQCLHIYPRHLPLHCRRSHRVRLAPRFHVYWVPDNTEVLSVTQEFNSIWFPLSAACYLQTYGFCLMLSTLRGAWCKTIVTYLFYITSYSSFAPSPRLGL